MHFKNSDTEICLTVDGYTDFPEAFSEEIGKNALVCTVSYLLPRDWGEGVLFDEIFQTYDITRFCELLSDLLCNKTDNILYKDEWDYFTFNAKKAGNKFEVYVNIIDRCSTEDINGTFVMTFFELKEIQEELQEYMLKFPSVD